MFKYPALTKNGMNGRGQMPRQLLTQMLNMYIHGSLHNTVGISPDDFVQNIPGEDPARIVREELQKL
jgi:hypothetical protein